ncbi:MAG: hypothetical protein RMK99_15770 [Anaerolineales bacterium]|nr:hypothetical protein [Anaerolineales bacterium]
MDRLLENPLGLLAVLCLFGAVLFSTLGLIPLLRGASPDFLRRLVDSRESDLWRRAFTGGREAQRKQAERLDELRRLVAQLPQSYKKTGDGKKEIDEEQRT